MNQKETQKLLMLLEEFKEQLNKSKGKKKSSFDKNRMGEFLERVESLYCLYDAAIYEINYIDEYH